MKFATAALAALLSIACFVLPAPAAAEPFITATMADMDNMVLTIEGINLPDSAVFMGKLGGGVNRLNVLSATATKIEAQLPTVDPGTYLVALVISLDRLWTSTVAVGAVGPQGPAGQQGDAGQQGIQGPAGAKGDKGDPGNDAAGFTAATRPASFCDGTNNGTGWFDTSDNTMRICAGVGTVKSVGVTTTYLNGHAIFATSGTWEGTLGGLAGADAKCQAAGDAGTSTTAFGATWTALLSDAATHARDRVNIAAPVRLVNGTVVADDAADLWDESIQAAVSLDENGSAATASVWTGSNSSGMSTSNHCVGWTSPSAAIWAFVGSASSTSFRWISGAAGFCDGARRIYCISSNPVDILVP